MPPHVIRSHLTCFWPLLQQVHEVNLRVADEEDEPPNWCVRQSFSHVASIMVHCVSKGLVVCVLWDAVLRQSSPLPTRQPQLGRSVGVSRSFVSLFQNISFPPPTVCTRACFTLDSTAALVGVRDPSSIPPVATAQSCYNKYHLEVRGVADSHWERSWSRLLFRGRVAG